MANFGGVKIENRLEIKAAFLAQSNIDVIEKMKEDELVGEIMKFWFHQVTTKKIMVT